MRQYGAVAPKGAIVQIEAYAPAAAESAMSAPDRFAR
jgi:hypothetical protein